MTSQTFVTIASKVALLGDARTETIARAIFAYNHFPGRKASEVPWPPERKQTLMRAWNMASVIAEALDSASQQTPGA